MATLVRYVLEHFGNRVLFVASFYVYPFESNRIMRELFEQVGGEVVDEIYLSLYAPPKDFERVMQPVRRQYRMRSNRLSSAVIFRIYAVPIVRRASIRCACSLSASVPTRST
ncbi:transporter substrate-binding protein [Pseudomonas rhodesiae]|uniref:transporter substrate-binding protein n=1 Tax=Pseudomonas rhodesiae TaxID=76760 RepID=UPI001BCD2D69|nr:transporter substrate-binding protein [Pseudomonas rhodesiae]